MPPLLRRPPPAFAAVFAALIGLLLPILIVAFFLWLDWQLERRFSALRDLLPAGTTSILMMALGGAIFGLAICAILAWATPRKTGRSGRFFALVAFVFAVVAVFVFGPKWFISHRFMQNAPAAMLVSTLCGTAMAYGLAVAARGFGAEPMLSAIRVALVGGGVAGIGMGLVVGLASVTLVQFLPVLWLGLVTYFCLKPLAQVPKTGL